MDVAARTIKPSATTMSELMCDMPEMTADARCAVAQLEALLESKQAWIRKFRSGHEAEVLRYGRWGEGLQMSHVLLDEFRAIEDRLEQRIRRLEADAGDLARDAFWGLLFALAGTVVLA